MDTFRKDGVYLKMYDAVKDGYYTMENGKMKKHKYGLLDKLYDIHRYGKTMNISYGYVYFHKSKLRDEAELELYIGSIGGELSEILRTWRNSSFRGKKSHHWQEFSFNNEHTAKYLDQKNRECFLTVLRDGNLLIQDYFDFNTGEPKTNEYNFYLLPR